MIASYIFWFIALSCIHESYQLHIT